MLYSMLAGLNCATSSVNPYKSRYFSSKCFKVSLFILVSTTNWLINVCTALVSAKRQTLSQGHNPQGQGQGQGLGLQGQGQGRCQGQCQYGSLFSQNFKTQTFIAGLVMTNFILIARFSTLLMKLTVTF